MISYGGLLRRAALRAAVAPCTLLAQVQPQGAAAPAAGMLNFTTTNAAAVTELRTSLDRYNLWAAQASAEHIGRALELEPTFGLARTIQAIIVAGPTAVAEFNRGVTEASSASAGEMLLALSAREVNAGRAPSGRRISQTAAELLPNDRHVATWRAIQLSDTLRVNAFRDVATRFPDYTGAKTWLAYYLTPPGLDSIVRANADEAMRVAMDAVRLAPNESGTHAAVAHVLTYTNRFAEAKQHLAAATRMMPVASYAYYLVAQIAAVEGNMPVMRAALDSAAWANPNVNGAFNARRARALVALSEGNPQQAMAELTQQLKDAEAISARAEILNSHVWMAYVSGAIRDSAGVEQHLAALKTMDHAPAILATNEVISYTLAGNGIAARRALNDWGRLNGPRPDLNAAVNATRTQDLHRYTGMTLVAERKPVEAMVELRQGGENAFRYLFTIEAYKQQKKNKEADAERAAFFERKQLGWATTAVPIIRYRAKK